MEEHTSKIEPQRKQAKKKMKEMWEKIQSKVYNSTGNSDISKPMMVFSIIGDANSFAPRPWQTIVFQTALIEAAKNGGETWILYRDKEEGVSKIVKKAYEHYEDIEFLKSVDLNDPRRHIKLIAVSDEAEEELDYDYIYRWTPYRKNHKKKRICKIKDEDKNLEMEFESFVSKREVALFGATLKFKIPIPVAIIMCEGDLETIARISNALKKNLPVIIMKGSGKAADLTLGYLENPKELRKRAIILLGIKLQDPIYAELEKYLKEIRKHRDLVSEFDPDAGDSLLFSNIVGDALIRSMSMKKTLKKKKNEENKESTTAAVFAVSQTTFTQCVNTCKK